MAQEDEISDQQIEVLLARASERLKAKANVKHTIDDGKTSYTFPKLNAGKLEKPYVSTRGDVASVDASRLLEEKQRKQANGARKVEDPVAAKKEAIEVCWRQLSWVHWQ